MRRYQHIAITGASSGLGRALAIAYAGPGITLHLAGRNPSRLAETAATCRIHNASVTETILDVTDAETTANWIESRTHLDLVIANAGIYASPGGAHLESPAQLRAVFATNINGAFNTTLPAITLMSTQPPDETGLRGRVAIIGSIAGLIALPTSPGYSASKAALDFWVTAAAPNAAKAGIGLTIIRPGFIRTPMTDANPYKMPGLMTAEDAAGRILAGLAAGKTHITFPKYFAAYARLGQLLPKTWLATLPNKPSK